MNIIRYKTSFIIKNRCKYKTKIFRSYKRSLNRLKHKFRTRSHKKLTIIQKSQYRTSSCKTPIRIRFILNLNWKLSKTTSRCISKLIKLILHLTQNTTLKINCRITIRSTKWEHVSCKRKISQRLLTLYLKQLIRLKNLRVSIKEILRQVRIAVHAQ